MTQCRELRSRSKATLQNQIIENTFSPDLAVPRDESILKRDSTLHENCIQQNEAVNSCSDSVADTIYESDGIVSLYRGIGNGYLCFRGNESQSLNLEIGQKKNDVTVEMPIPNVFALRRTHARSEHTSSGTKYGDIDHSNNNGSSGDNNVRREDKEEWEVSNLSSVWGCRHDPDVFIVVADTSASSSALGWGVRNVLALIGAHAGSYPVRVPIRDDNDNDNENDIKNNAVPAISQSSTCGSGNDNTKSSAPYLMTNIIALRGSIAKRLYACSSQEKVVDFLAGLTNNEIGEIPSIKCYDYVLYLLFH